MPVQIPTFPSLSEERMLMLKKKIVSEYEFGLPLVLDHKCFIDYSRAEMLEEAKQSPAKLEAYQVLFGKDPGCPNWLPSSRLGDDKRALYPCSGNILGTDVVKKVKFYLHYFLFGFMKDAFQRRSTTSIPEALFHPGSEQVTDKNGARAAVFRQAVLYRYFESTQQFWEQFEAEYDEIKDCTFYLPIDAPEMHLTECHQLMREAGEVFGEKMACMILDTIGEMRNFTRTCLLAINLRPDPSDDDYD